MSSVVVDKCWWVIKFNHDKKKRPLRYLTDTHFSLMFSSPKQGALESELQLRSEMIVAKQGELENCHGELTQIKVSLT